MFVTLREPGVHPLLMASTHFLWHPPASYGVHPLLMASTRFLWCPPASYGVHPLLMASTRFLWCPPASYGVHPLLFSSYYAFVKFRYVIHCFSDVTRKIF